MGEWDTGYSTITNPAANDTLLIRHLAATPPAAGAVKQVAVSDLAAEIFSLQTAVAPSGLTGATAASRYAGATASGPPVSGTFAVGDFVVDQTGLIWVCHVAGSPGVWSGTLTIAANAAGNFQVFGGSAFLNNCFFDISTPGNGVQVAEGANAKQGTAVLVAGSKVVANTSVTASSRIFLTSQVDGGTPGWLRVSARTAGTSFTVTSSSATDTSTVAYEIFEPG